jgi:hypothetical protein
MKNFHEVSARNVHEYLLKSRIGKVRLLEAVRREEGHNAKAARGYLTAGEVRRLITLPLTSQ